MKITNLKVPSQYILERNQNPEPLLLDCEYDLPAGEKGFVLKWYLNDQLIYQWISTTHPRFYVHVSPLVDSPKNKKSFHRNLQNLLRNSVDLNYTHTEQKHLSRHRALTITKPTINMTGVYTCAVGTFQSEEKRSSHMQIIVSETEFRLKIEEPNDGSNDIYIECSVHDIFPKPKLMIR